MRVSSRRRAVRGSLSVVAALAAVAFTGGVAQALPDIGDGGSPIDELPLVGDGGPESCSFTSSNPRSRRACNQDGANGRDGSPGSVSGRRTSHHDRESYRHGEDRQITDGEADYGPDVNGAPRRPGMPHAVVPPGSESY